MSTVPREIDFPRPPPGGTEDPCCPTCGYMLRHLTENRCPECGNIFDPRDADQLYRVSWLRRRARAWIKPLPAWPPLFVLACVGVCFFWYTPWQRVGNWETYLAWVGLHTLGALWLRDIARRVVAARLLRDNPEAAHGGWRNEVLTGLAVVVACAVLWMGCIGWAWFRFDLPWLEKARARAAAGWGAEDCRIGYWPACEAFPTDGGVRIIVWREFGSGSAWGYEYIARPSAEHWGWRYEHITGNWYSFEF